MNAQGRFRPLITLVLFCTSIGGCVSLQLEDESAPSVEVAVEAEYDVLRWRQEKKSDWASPPPRRKQEDNDWHVTSFRVRGRFSNAVTWYDAEGSMSQGLLEQDARLSAQEIRLPETGQHVTLAA